MKTSYQGVLWLALILSVVTAVTLLIVMADLSLFEANPVLYTVSVVTATIGLALVMRNRAYLPLLKNMRLQGRLLVSPFMLLLLASPAALIYIYYDLNGKETLNLLSALFASLAAIFFLASFFTWALPSLATIFKLYAGEGAQYCRIRYVRSKAVTVMAALSVFFILLKIFTGYKSSGLLFLLPLFALFQVIIDIILSVEFRNTIVARISSEGVITPVPEVHITESAPVKGFRSLLLFPSHYLDTISGDLDYLINRADDSYASEVVRVAEQTYDPALIPALKTIVSGTAFSEIIRHEATVAMNNIEKYFSDPVRNSDMLRMPGIHERTAVARTILTSQKTPRTSDVLKLLNDSNPEIRRVGLAAAGLYMMKDLREEAVQALFVPETEKEAFYLLKHFGPDNYGDIIGNAFMVQNKESVSLMVMRLLNMMPLPKVTPYMTDIVAGGPVTVRLRAVRYLCEQRFVPEAKLRQYFGEIINETVFNTGKIIALQLEAKKNKYFIQSDALEWEKSMNMELLFSLLSLVAGNATAEMIRTNATSGTAYGAGIAAEVIEAMEPTPVSRPLQALLGHHSDKSRLTELSSFFPLREITRGSLPTMILSADQNITGVWTKACALHKIADKGLGLEKEIAVSYLFSNSQLLQEEAANVIRTVNPGWFGEVEARLPEQVRTRVTGVINGTIPEAAMIFAKTRFLSLCFNKIPEERTIMLAIGMRYSESYDAESLPGVLTWIVPSGQGKSGLYSLPVSDITHFVFHFSEYTDIFVNYMDNRVSDPVGSIVNYG